MASAAEPPHLQDDSLLASCLTDSLSEPLTWNQWQKSLAAFTLRLALQPYRTTASQWQAFMKKHFGGDWHLRLVSSCPDSASDAAETIFRTRTGTIDPSDHSLALLPLLQHPLPWNAWQKILAAACAPATRPHLPHLLPTNDRHFRRFLTPSHSPPACHCPRRL